MTDLVDVVLDALAVYRGTRLVTVDRLGEGLREWVIGVAYIHADRADEPFADKTRARGEPPKQDSTDGTVFADPPLLAYLIGCAWCSSIWLGAGAVVLRRVFPRVWEPLRNVGALSAISGIIAGRA